MPDRISPSIETRMRKQWRDDKFVANKSQKERQQKKKEKRVKGERNREREGLMLNGIETSPTRSRL